MSDKNPPVSRSKLISIKRRLAIPLLVIALVGLIWVVYIILPSTFNWYANDWSETFRPAALELVSGRSPYNIPTFRNPPWLLILLFPLALLPVKLGGAIIFVASIASYGFIAHKLGAKPVTIFIILVSPLMLMGSFVTNMDWLAALGYVLKPQIGLFFVLMKPQIGSMVILYWLIEAWRHGGLREVIWVFSPVLAALSLSFLVFGFWPQRAYNLIEVPWNVSLWPASIPMGIALFVAAIRQRKMGLAIIASPLLSPYVAPYSWINAVLGLLPSQMDTIIVMISFWFVQLMYQWPFR